jgi:hypothetical protein
MDSEINEAIEFAYRIEREYGFLHDHQSRMGATFMAIRRLAETGDTSVIDGCPDWLLTELQEWVQSFRQTGEFGFVSNLGSVDHSALMAKANAVLVEVNAQHGAQADGHGPSLS